MNAVIIIEGLVILLLLVLVGGLLKSHAEILRQLDRLGAVEDRGASSRPRLSTNLGRTPLAQISGLDPKGGEVLVGLDLGRDNTLVAFLSSGCASCRLFWTEFSLEFELPDPSTRTIVVTKGTDSESPSKIAELAPDSVTTVMSSEAWDAFQVPMTPYFVYISGGGDVMGEGSATTWKHLLSLLRQSAADSMDPTAMDTDERVEFANDSLKRSGIKPDDPSLYENPLTP